MRRLRIMSLIERLGAAENDNINWEKVNAISERQLDELRLELLNTKAKLGAAEQRVRWADKQIVIEHEHAVELEAECDRLKEQLELAAIGLKRIRETVGSPGTSREIWMVADSALTDGNYAPPLLDLIAEHDAPLRAKVAEQEEQLAEDEKDVDTLRETVSALDKYSDDLEGRLNADKEAGRMKSVVIYEYDSLIMPGIIGVDFCSDNPNEEYTLRYEKEDIIPQMISDVITWIIKKEEIKNGQFSSTPSKGGYTPAAENSNTLPTSRVIW